MKVSELITHLQTLDPDLPVLSIDSYGEAEEVEAFDVQRVFVRKHIRQPGDREVLTGPTYGMDEKKPRPDTDYAQGILIKA